MTEPPPETDSRPPESPAPDSRRGSFGAWLRHQREARSVSLREIADSSKISIRYLDALEQDRFDALPAPVFARGFLREYARVVGLNPDEVVNLFLVALEDRRGAAQASEPARISRQKKSPSNVGYGLLLALAVIAFLAIAAALSFYVERRGADAAPPSTFVAPAPPAPAPAVETPLPAAPAELGAAPEASAAPEAGSPVPQRATAPPPAQNLNLVLSFRQDCWVETVIDGRRRASELRAGGETVTFEAEEYVLLTLGNASAVSIELNGRPFELPAGSTRVVRSLRIDRATAGLPPAAQPAAGP
jgi:cytoskeleton protein RodZ